AAAPGSVGTVAYAVPEYVGAVARGPLDGTGRGGAQTRAPRGGGGRPGGAGGPPAPPPPPPPPRRSVVGTSPEPTLRQRFPHC
ncbi:hypothetical protein, partial [Nocardia brasiliensis]|uniref:hypothetical protein n=1 Tax=Nocardia brasiliensis TaxID=37326 RepID=UPI00245612A4